MRNNISLIDENKNNMISSIIYRSLISYSCPLPHFSSAVHAGFPSPTDDFLEGHLDLNEHLIRHPAATYYVRVKGNSMIKAGIHDGDLLIVDRSLEPRDNKVVIAIVDGLLTVKRLKKIKNKFFLVAENPDFMPIAINAENNVSIWGIVIHVIHTV
jgi:DNA polymerase V